MPDAEAEVIRLALIGPRRHARTPRMSAMASSAHVCHGFRSPVALARPPRWVGDAVSAKIASVPPDRRAGSWILSHPESPENKGSTFG
ncbi:hypothetical protein [Streptomyces californicus]